MESAGMLSVILMILNAVHVILGLLLAAASIWFFVEVHDLTNLRNSNHYLLDYNVYWPQAIPWVFMIIGLFVLFISGCGCMGAKKKTRGLLQMYVTFEIIVVLSVITAVVVSLVFADSTSTDKFIKDTVWDAYTNMKTEHDVEKSFGVIEQRFQCCGADGPRDYINWRRDFPTSCCDTYYHGWIGSYNIDCDFTNKLANERHGCSEVAANYTRVVIKALSAVATLAGFIGVINIIVAIFLFKSLNGRDNISSKTVTAYHDVETKKVLLN